MYWILPSRTGEPCFLNRTSDLFRILIVTDFRVFFPIVRTLILDFAMNCVYIWYKGIDANLIPYLKIGYNVL